MKETLETIELQPGPGRRRVYRVRHPELTESYSARDARDILADAGLIADGESVTWLGADFYQIGRPRMKETLEHYVGAQIGEPRIYRIIRFRFSGRARTIRSNVTETEAKKHCSLESTSSHSTGPGSWFDGFDYMKGYKPREER